MMINLCSSSDDGAGDDAGGDAGDGETKQAGGTIGAAFSKLGNARICAFLGESRGKVTSPVLDCSVPGLTYLRASAATWKTKKQMGDDYVENRGLDDFWEDACDAVRTTRPVNPFRMIEQLGATQKHSRQEGVGGVGPKGVLVDEGSLPQQAVSTTICTTRAALTVGLTVGAGNEREREPCVRRQSW